MARSAGRATRGARSQRCRCLHDMEAAHCVEHASPPPFLSEANEVSGRGGESTPRREASSAGSGRKRPDRPPKRGSYSPANDDENRPNSRSWTSALGLASLCMALLALCVLNGFFDEVQVDPTPGPPTPPPASPPPRMIVATVVQTEHVRIESASSTEAAVSHSDPFVPSSARPTAPPIFSPTPCPVHSPHRPQQLSPRASTPPPPRPLSSPPSSPPPPPPPAPRLPPPVLNARFAQGRPSDDIATAGVLIRQFDSLSNEGKPWLPCRGSGSLEWCRKYGDRFPSSIVNQEARKLYYGESGIGGFVLSATAEYWCAYPEGNACARPRTTCQRTTSPLLT